MNTVAIPSVPHDTIHPDIEDPCSQLTPWCHLCRGVPAVKTVHSIDLDVTEACNLACVYCFKWQKKVVHMSEATAKAAIDWLLESCGDARDLRVNLMGGEPLIRFNLIRKIVPYAKLRARQMGKSLHFGCTTNCTILNDEILDFWRRYGMGFHCSIDGIPSIQNQNRPFQSGKGSAELVEKNVPKILAYRPEVMARSTITPVSVPYLVENAKYFVSLGFQSMTFKMAVNCEWSETDLEILREQYRELGRFYIERHITGKPLNIEDFSHGLQNLHSTEPSGSQPCGAGRGLVLVDPRGDLWPCHRFGPHQCSGGFQLGRLGEPFNNQLRRIFLNYHRLEDGTVDCLNCRAAIICRSWCYAECIDSANSLYDPGSFFCEGMRILSNEVLRVNNLLCEKHPNVLRRILQEKKN